MATSAAELRRLLALVEELRSEVKALLAVEEREQEASRRLGEPAPRLGRIS